MYNRTPYNKTTYNRTTSIVFSMVPASPECLGKLVLIPQFVNRKLPIPIKKGAQPALKPFCIP